MEQPMNEKNLPGAATTPDPYAPELSDPMDPRIMPWYPNLMPRCCGTSEPAPRSDFDAVAAPYSLPAAPTPATTPTEQCGMHYAVRAGGGFVCGTDRVSWPCETIWAYQQGVMAGAYDERSRSYDALHARFEALPYTRTEARVALYEAANFIITQSPV
jgi:hypothetical protein